MSVIILSLKSSIIYKNSNIRLKTNKVASSIGKILNAKEVGNQFMRLFLSYFKIWIIDKVKNFDINVQIIKRNMFVCVYETLTSVMEVINIAVTYSEKPEIIIMKKMEKILELKFVLYDNENENIKTRFIIVSKKDFVKKI